MAKLTLTRCTVENGRTVEKRGRGDIFKAQVNPADYKHSHGISYSNTSPEQGQPLGKSGVTTKFSAINAEKVSFSMVLDGTGVVADDQKRSVADQVKALKAICYTYSGKDHEPNVVKVSWGKGLTAFYGRMESMGIDYTLFRASGEALRAKVALSFVSFHTEIEEALKAQRSSPDLTHRVEVRAGDRLPLLCHQVYKDQTAYLKVAEENGLDGFRALRPGDVLEFRPLR